MTIITTDPQLCPLSTTDHGSSLTHRNENHGHSLVSSCLSPGPSQAYKAGTPAFKVSLHMLPQCAVQGTTSRCGQSWPVQGKGEETLARYKPWTSSNTVRLSQVTWAFPHGQVGYSHQLILEPNGRTLHSPLTHLIELAWALNSVCCPCAELW